MDRLLRLGGAGLGGLGQVGNSFCVNNFSFIAKEFYIDVLVIISCFCYRRRHQTHQLSILPNKYISHRWRC